MSIDKLSINSSGSSSRMMPQVTWGGGSSSPQVSQKSFGEPLPQMADIRNNPVLLAQFGQMGAISRIQRKLITLSRKKGRIIPAKGTIACALQACEETDYEDVVFVGVDFAEGYFPEEETMAGVLAHEWGHLISEFPKGMDPNKYSWQEIFDLRKEEETYADSYAGKMLYLMGYRPNGLVQFLQKPELRKETHKYHSAATREAIIKEAYQTAQRRQQQMQSMKLFSQATYSNPFTARLIAVV